MLRAPSPQVRDPAPRGCSRPASQASVRFVPDGPGGPSGLGVAVATRVRIGVAVVAVMALVTAGCGQPGLRSDRYPRRIPVGVDGPHPLRFFNVWPLWWRNADVPN